MKSQQRVRSLRSERRDRELELRREDILGQAAGVFAERGFDGAQVGEIAARSEVSLATVYALFASKEELFQAVIEVTAAAMRRSVEASVLAEPDPAERLLCLIDALFACFDQNRDLLRIYARGTQGLPWKIRLAMGDSAQSIFEGFTRWVIERAQEAARATPKAGIEPEPLALAIIGAVITTATHAVEQNPSRSPAEFAGPVRALFERVVRP